MVCFIVCESGEAELSLTIRGLPLRKGEEDFRPSAVNRICGELGDSLNSCFMCILKGIERSPTGAGAPKSFSASALRTGADPSSSELSPIDGGRKGFGISYTVETMFNGEPLLRCGRKG